MTTAYGRPSPQMVSLFVAIRSGDLAVATECATRLRAEVNGRYEGRTALSEAALWGRSALCKTLLELGANPDIRDCEGRAAIDYAASIADSACLCVLLEHGVACDTASSRSITPLMVAAYEGRSENCRLLLAAGAMPDRLDWQQRSALHMAVKQGHVATVRTLLTGGATTEPGMVDERGTGRTPLELALPAMEQESTSAAIVLLLLKAGATPADDDYPRLAEHCAQDFNVDLAQELLRRGCAVELEAAAQVADNSDLRAWLASRRAQDAVVATLALEAATP